MSDVYVSSLFFPPRFPVFLKKVFRCSFFLGGGGGGFFETESGGLAD